ncbi:FAD-binding and (Fe-S)-binding domain-containing protein [Pedomonas mirosovicensis]|uniref:FAD-binding and (Fe-S)-binding domain-containing protein n=1 Tax=Pedomonas mirosovicensis TaxID=2908641 RepID=UPI0021681849|nr:FAD-binding and (Fe-S)-binding domain-containing protein [Pedomonas mirosovicensis]MCH8686717.1 FAD-binding oxidoreductase [Pedomonas mirosovicensis]
MADERIRKKAPSGRIEAEYAPFAAEKAKALERDLKATLSCDVDFGPQGRALFAADASNYRQVPIGVVTPRTREDVIEAVRLCRKHDAPILARGGGTSLAGQCCNVAVVIDFSRHLNRILSLDPDQRTAVVEPGCILDTLRNAAEEHHLTFGPDPATHDHNTLGGMIGNNSCGVHSVMSGRTSDYVERLTILTYDGHVLDIGPTPDETLSALIQTGGRQGEIYKALLALRDRYGSLIEQIYPQIPRRVSGFENLDTLLPGHGFNVAKALTGTEGTCAIILDATLRLIPSPPCRVLCLMGFDSIFEAADAVPDVLRHGPAALEGFDDLLYDAVKRGNVDHRGLRFFPEGKGWLIVELGGNSVAEATAKATALQAAMEGRCAASIVTDKKQQKQIWVIREASLGATAFVPGQPDTWPGWEDSAVAPERVGAYLRDLKALFHKYGYNPAVYGHFGDGLIHCRVDFDIRSEEGLATYRAFVTDAARLVTDYGGTLSGEHGDGEARAELLEIMYGPDLVNAFRAFKAIWDPDNRLNPGKAINPYPLDANLRLGPGYDPPKVETHYAFPADKGSFARATIRCVGVGKCRRKDVGAEVMCPSYLLTNQEKHSTRGRAHLLHEMVRGGVIEDGWDSAEVEDALSLCLACKGCKRDCPVAVDMATYKSEFRAHHYAHRRRPRSAYSFGLIHRWAQLAEPVPWLANFAFRTPGLASIAKWAGGIDQGLDVPAMARQSFRRWFRRRPSRTAGERVILWPDTFTNHFRPEAAIAATRLLEAAGFAVHIPSHPLCCGRPLYDWGMLDRAKTLWEQTLAVLADDIAAGTPMIGLEPACTSAFKDELPNLFSGRKEAESLSHQTIHFTDFVEAHIDRFPEPRRGGHAIVQAHCHHHAIIGFDSELSLLDRLGLTVERPPQGCCGMAGPFGMAVETARYGAEIGERALLPRIRAASKDTIIVADGFSCREQIALRGGRTAIHLAQLLAERMLS